MKLRAPPVRFPQVMLVVALLLDTVVVTSDDAGASSLLDSTGPGVPKGVVDGRRAQRKTGCKKGRLAKRNNKKNKKGPLSLQSTYSAERVSQIQG
ncbi:hypothetical protein E2C01_004589 [Portunus trituberculatus]|uniref:Secreted protein n=1 Tax=Portunus trituberculatus TaxID=210409 RepID=A0A5B7CTD8_PORTR|nr:hypothetical protein [Portunus trituberculatus]